MRHVTKRRREQTNQAWWFWPTVVGLPIGAIVLVQILWAIIAHVAGFPTVLPPDSGTWLAIAGGVIGAVFTIGGLVIALGSLLSQMTIENRARQVMEDKFRDLQPELMRAMEARILSLRATIAAEKRHWREAEVLTKQAMVLAPDLPGTQAALGLAMAEDICVEYAVQQGLDDINRDLVYRRWRTGDRAETLLPEAIKWLEDAVESGEEDDRRVWTMLARLYGMHRRRDRMLEAVAQAVDRFAGASDELLAPTSLSMLINACEGDERTIERLAQLLRAPLMMPEEAVTRAIAQADATGCVKTTWLVAPKSSSNSTSMRSRPCVLPLTTDGEGKFVDYAHSESGDGEAPEITVTPIADYAYRLCSDYIFVRQLSPTPDAAH